KIEVAGEKSSGVAVSKSAVIDGGVEKYLFVSLGDGHFEPRVIETGAYFGDYVEVVSGVEEGEEIVVSSHFLIDSESRLKASLRSFGGAGEKKPPEHKH
ncbi:MAG: efflux RND transporter periplasmic adaptor subunit, partial [Deltaproteobacteria bacterium]|nr:efflux RND transporter periplasmic adaptor subunit [Deltaproteobacteria bacterium]